MKAVLALSLVLLCLLPTHTRAAEVDITAPSAILYALHNSTTWHEIIGLSPDTGKVVQPGEIGRAHV